MTEQMFSQEYIAYILSDEAKALQGQRPALSFGDRVWILGDASVGIVKQVWTSSSRSIRASYDVMAPDLGGPTIFEGLREDFAWLPTLFQLIGVIEGAGWEWSRNPGIWQAWKPTAVHGTASEWTTIRDTEDMLAAAQLAVRSMEGK